MAKKLISFDDSKTGEAALPDAVNTVLRDTYVPAWKPNTAYTAGQAVVSPAGDVVLRKTNSTSRATYDATEAGAWNLSATVTGKLSRSDADGLYQNIKTVRAQLTGGVQTMAATTLTGGNRGHRIPFKSPVQTTRWRMKIRNFATDGAAGAGDPVIGLSGLALGVAQLDAEGNPNGAYIPGTGVALATGGDYTIPADGTYWTSPWYDQPAHQIAPGRIHLLSIANRIPAGESKRVLMGTGWQWNGAETVVDPAVAPYSVTPSQSRFEVVVEFESSTVRKVGAFIGDSIVDGVTAGRQASHQAWPMLWANSHNSIAINAGVSGRTLANWANINHPVWTSVDWANVTADFGFIALGTNDISTGTATLADLKANFLATLANLRTKIGADRPMYASTVLPRKFNEANETLRKQYNAWLATCPGGLATVFDFATVMLDPAVAAPPQLLPVYDSDGSHPTPLGYLRMASIPGQLG
ncbi:SGNH/GDSL hydrolase family protein [Rhodococcus qingshengii]|uniref:SGNH/GDSL hydrolase family protein n=1 Tax=Rhodococcus TaxID=1827 RepID=UPI001E54B526|nr:MULTISPECIES: SGNH/GDSL hydrolase family protein [Rhodococcus]MCD2099516.1 SGNH/GDSL hydrolase family protein [Rhodococcus rhodochrous]MCD2123884.1 SGNH/GDSL hydrolase family protein [Rhodococcus rhodochrous]MCQ4136689.1 SGNH/GDSL hydrolase family protein [Rhodococcus rhodochrous]MDJ0490650.1 SGNH/GDSL hydrolase family protein [Rhodococcus qingshengii]